MNTSLSGVKYAPVHPRAKRRILTAIVTAFFAVLCAIIVFPLLAGFLASLRPGRDLLQNGLALNLDFSTMSLSNYAYLFSGAVESVKYFTWYKNSLILTVEMVTCVLLACYEEMAALARGVRAVVTAEEHSRVGGLASHMAMALRRMDVPMDYVAVEDCFGQSAHSGEELMEHYGLTSDAIERKARALLGVAM